MANLSSDESRSRTLQMLRTAFGETVTDALDASDVIEIMVNPDGKLWIERVSLGRVDTGETMTAESRERIIRLVGTHIDQDVTTFNPIISAELPGSGERFEA